MTTPLKVTFEIPLMPPSVNHYIEHPSAGVHKKSAAAKSFECQFPIFARDLFVVSESGRFSVSLEFWPGAGARGDVDNRNKVLLDCIAARGMLRKPNGKECSDAWIKRMSVEINDSAADRARGPLTRITIEAMA